MRENNILTSFLYSFLFLLLQASKQTWMAEAWTLPGEWAKEELVREEKPLLWLSSPFQS